MTVDPRGQDENDQAPAVPDGFTLVVGGWTLGCKHKDWGLHGYGQEELEAACAAARQHTLDAHPFVPATEDSG